MDEGAATDPTGQRLMAAATAAFLAHGYEAARLELFLYGVVARPAP